MIKIDLPFPPSVNAAYANSTRGKGRHKSKAYLQWEKLAAIGIRDSHRLGYGPYSLAICLRKPDRRRRDLGNYEKVVSDLLVAHGVVKDDSMCERITLQWSETILAECVVIVQQAEQEIAA